MKAKKKTPAGPMRAVGYIRVSTADQADNGVSLDAQRQKIEAYAVFQGFELVEIVVDAGVSAGKPLAEREGGLRLLELVRPEGECTAIVAAKLDRLFRDAADCLSMTRRWDDSEVGLHLLDMGIDTRSAMGRAFLTMAAGFAELERNLIGERTRAGLEQVVREGGRIGRAPYGWMHGERGPDGRRVMVEVPEERETIALIVRWHERESKNFTEIATLLDERGVATKREGTWRNNAVRKIYIASKGGAAA